MGEATGYVKFLKDLTEKEKTRRRKQALGDGLEVG